jgi:hypothetical protein
MSLQGGVELAKKMQDRAQIRPLRPRGLQAHWPVHASCSPMRRPDEAQRMMRAPAPPRWRDRD